MLSDHFLMHRAGAMNTDAQSARRDSFDFAQVASKNFHEYSSSEAKTIRNELSRPGVTPSSIQPLTALVYFRLFRVYCERSIHHRGTEFAEFGAFFFKNSLLRTLRASVVQSPSPVSQEI